MSSLGSFGVVMGSRPLLGRASHSFSGVASPDMLSRELSLGLRSKQTVDVSTNSEDDYLIKCVV